MNAPEKLEVPVVVKDTDGNEHEVERLVYRLERNGKSRWAEMFGTPEMAAGTMARQCFGATSEECNMCVFDECDGKLRNSGTYQTVYDALLEWLRGESDGK